MLSSHIHFILLIIIFGDHKKIFSQKKNMLMKGKPINEKNIVPPPQKISGGTKKKKLSISL